MLLLALLRAHLDQRKAVNRAYSLRAYARSLGVHHATLSRLLAGRTLPTGACLERIARGLRLDAAQLAVLRDEAGREQLRRAIVRVDFRADSRWLAGVSGLPLDTVNLRLQQMLMRGELRMGAARAWQLNPPASRPTRGRAADFP